VSIAEVEALATAMPERFRRALLLASWCQLRRGEILGLRRRDVDPLLGVLHIEQNAQYLSDGSMVIGPPKTVAGRRRIAVRSHILPWIEHHLQEFVGAAPNALLFTGVKGAPLRPHVLQSAWSKAQASVARPDVHLHDLRHSGATWAATTGATTRELMARVGHASPRAALIYQHASDDRDAVIASALAELTRPAEIVQIRPVDDAES
jgi:integrase